MKINLFMIGSQYEEVSKCAEKESLSVQDFILKSLPGAKPRLTLADVESRMKTNINSGKLNNFSIPQLFTKEEFEKTDGGSHTSVGKQLKSKVTEMPYFIGDYLICFAGPNTANLGFYCIVYPEVRICKGDAKWIEAGTVKKISKDGKVQLYFGNGLEEYSFDDFGHTIFPDTSVAQKKFPKAKISG